MLRRVSVQVSRNIQTFSRFYNTTTATTTAVQPKLLTGLNPTTVRNLHSTSIFSFQNTTAFWASDPCNPNAGQEEEEDCTVTPCCRVFRLQKEHPMKKLQQEKEKSAKKDDKCGKDDKKKEEPKKDEPKKDTKKAPAPA